MRNSRIVVRALGLLFLFIFALGVWSWWQGQDNKEVVVRNMSAHDQAYETAWIADVDTKTKMVVVRTVDSKVRIEFRVTREFLDFLDGRKNWIVPVTFYCNGKPDMSCNLDEPFELYVATRKVEPISIIMGSNSE